MNTTDRIRRAAAAIISVGAAAILLTGCNQLTVEEIQGSSHRVVETGTDFWEGESWSYIGPDGTERALSENCQTSIWEGRCWTDSEGLVEFRYSKGKSGISSERMIFDGVERPMECQTSSFWSGEYVCAVL